MSNYFSLINGKFKDTISVLDRGLSYGDGLFETMSWNIIDRKRIVGVEFWKRHLKRIKEGCMVTKLSMPPTRLLDNYKDKILRKCALKGFNSGILKILITRGVGGRGYKFDKNIVPTIIFLSFPKTKTNQSLIKKGINVRFCKSPISINSQLSGLKHLNRLDSVMARSEWQAKNYFEGIFLDEFGNMLEGTMSNIFFSKDNILYTPSLSNSGINGIMRQVVIDKSYLFFKKTLQININKNCLEDFEEMFITNSVLKIFPVRKLEKKKFIITKATEKLIDFFSVNNLEDKRNNLELI